MKIFTIVCAVVVAVGEEFTLLKAESPAPKTEQIRAAQIMSDRAPQEPEEPSQPEPEETNQPEAEETNPAPESLTVSASVYFPEPRQTDSTPFITADGSRINKKDPGKHRWIAVSRDLHSRWGGDISYGDSLWVSGISGDLDGLYVVRDVMNRRIRNRIDLLVSPQDNIMGFWKNVSISKAE